MPVVDTLRLKNRLSESGMPETQAQVLVEELDEALGDAITGQLASKDDMTVVKADVSAVKTELAVVKADVSAVKTELVAIKADVSAIKTDLSAVKVEMAELRGQVGKLTWLGGTLVVLQIAILLKILFP